MNYRQAKIVLRTSIFLLVILSLFGIYRCVSPRGADSADGQAGSDVPVITEVKEVAKSTIDKMKSAVNRQRLKTSSKIRNHATQFNDLNEDHLRYAMKVGIKPIAETRDIMAITKPLVRLESCGEYKVDKLTHSYPYLVEPAALLLHDIGAEFQRKLREQGGGDYSIKVTSLLRTQESVNRLKRRNVNSTQNSAHLYATTFDISYVDFPEAHFNTKKHPENDLKNLLAEVLLEMREQGRCLVKFERKQGCFHITTTGK